MRHLFIVAAFAGVLAVAVPAAANQGPVLTQYDKTDAVAVLLAIDQAPARQNAVIRFWKPVRVGDRILMGKYIIEHDNDRMARGEPCTHIYDFYSKKLVVSFHCTHLTRDRTDTATVNVKNLGDFPVAVMTEFQFAGDSDAHGVPTSR